MSYTGSKALSSGIYKPTCHCGKCKQIALSRGETFPPCNGCRRAVNWILIQPTSY